MAEGIKHKNILTENPSQLTLQSYVCKTDIIYTVWWSTPQVEHFKAVYEFLIVSVNSHKMCLNTQMLWPKWIINLKFIWIGEVKSSL